MNIEKIGEAICVVAFFTGGTCRPMRFRWSGRVYHVAAVNARWIDRQNDSYALHYSIQVGDETYYIHFDAHEVQWWLDELIVN